MLKPKLSQTKFGTPREASAEVFEEVRDHSALAKKIDDAFQKALREIGGTWPSLRVLS